MNARERFLAVMNFEPVDRTLKWEIGYWIGAVRRWYAEGLPCKVGVRADLVDGDVILAEVFPAVRDERETDVHEFLVLTAILDRLTGGLCDAVTGLEGGGRMVALLERFVVELLARGEVDPRPVIDLSWGSVAGCRLEGTGRSEPTPYSPGTAGCGSGDQSASHRSPPCGAAGFRCRGRGCLVGFRMASRRERSGVPSTAHERQSC